MRIASDLTTMPRNASISSTFRKLSGKRKSSRTASLMISTEEQCPAKLGQTGAIIPPDYPEVDRSGKLTRGQLTVPSHGPQSAAPS